MNLWYFNIILGQLFFINLGLIFSEWKLLKTCIDYTKIKIDTLFYYYDGFVSSKSISTLILSVNQQTDIP